MKPQMDTDGHRWTQMHTHSMPPMRCVRVGSFSICVHRCSSVVPVFRRWESACSQLMPSRGTASPWTWPQVIRRTKRSHAIDAARASRPLFAARPQRRSLDSYTSPTHDRQRSAASAVSPTAARQRSFAAVCSAAGIVHAGSGQYTRSTRSPHPSHTHRHRGCRRPTRTRSRTSCFSNRSGTSAGSRSRTASHAPRRVIHRAAGLDRPRRPEPHRVPLAVGPVHLDLPHEDRPDHPVPPPRPEPRGGAVGGARYAR